MYAASAIRFLFYAIFPYFTKTELIFWNFTYQAIALHVGNRVIRFLLALIIILTITIFPRHYVRTLIVTPNSIKKILRLVRLV